MSFQHHGNEPDRELEQERLLALLKKQQEGLAKRAWPEGRIGATDDGELAVKIESDPDKEIVRLDFGKPVAWVAMPPEQAIQWAQLLIQHARKVSKKPVSVVLH